MAYKSQIDRFDIERGDVLSLAREDVARLADYWEYSHPVLCNLFKWFLGAPEAEVQMSDPRDNRELRGLIEHQKKNAARRYDYLEAQRERKLGKSKTAVNHGQPRTQDKDKHKTKNSVSVDSSVLCGGASATPPDGALPSASPSVAMIGKQDIINARATMARYAPAPEFVYDPHSNECIGCEDHEKCHAGKYQTCRAAIDSRATGMDPLKYYDDFHRENFESWTRYANIDAYSEWISDLTHETLTDELKAALSKYRDTMGDDLFLRAIWTYSIQIDKGELPDKDPDGNPTNYGKLLFGRLKKLTAAQAILAQADAARKPAPHKSAS